MTDEARLQTREQMLLSQTPTPEPAQPAESPEARAREDNTSGEGFKFSEAVWADAVKETNRLCYELDITNADHIVLWLEHQLDGIKGPLAYIACRILDAHEAATTARPTERGAVEALEALFDQAFTDGIAAGKSGDDQLLAGSASAYARSAVSIVAPATDQAAEVEPELLDDIRTYIAKRVAVPVLDGPNGPISKGRNLLRRINAALDTQTATGRTMGGEDGLREALEVAEITLRLDGKRMRDQGMVTGQNEVALLTVQAALQNGGER